MSIGSRARRGLFVGVAATGALALGAAPALAHHCYVPMYSLNAPASDGWLVFSAEAGAAEIVGYHAQCQGAVDAGYDALRAGRMPVGIKIFERMTIGDPKGTGGSANPNGANGKGLEYFGAGSTLADEMVMTWIEAADAHEC
ncbi:hypothetical protein [Oryzobacter telluris]|uniref:hypothetical protein n=1 Tax=Oryzobacter telluris TaxID=3149179 RepID=UPI00370D1A6E